MHGNVNLLILFLIVAKPCTPSVNGAMVWLEWLAGIEHRVQADSCVVPGVLFLWKRAWTTTARLCC